MRKRIFNIMQYFYHPDSGVELINMDIVKSALEHKTITKWAYIIHDKDTYTEEDEIKDSSHKAGTLKQKHIHIVCFTENAVDISLIAKWFRISENFIDIPKGHGAFLDCVEYLTHSSEKEQLKGKYRYSNDEVFANFDFEAELENRNEDRLKYGRDLSDRDKQRYDVLYLGKTLSQCASDDKLLFMNDIENLKKLRSHYLANVNPPITRINYYVYGNGGIGKGLLCRALARNLYPNIVKDEDIFFEVGAKGVAFEGYDGQPVIIWNDRRAIDLLQELGGRGNVFNIFDTHPTKQKQNIKYSSIGLCNEVNIVNSVEGWEDFLNGLAGEYIAKDGTKILAEDKNQSYRRFPMIIPIREDDFDIYINSGFMHNTTNFLEYEMYKSVQGSLKKIAETCGAEIELSRKLEAQTVKPIVDIHSKIINNNDKKIDEKIILKKFENYGKDLSDLQIEDLSTNSPSQIILPF